jgi:hypothetical protein
MNSRNILRRVKLFSTDSCAYGKMHALIPVVTLYWISIAPKWSSYAQYCNSWSPLSRPLLSPSKCGSIRFTYKSSIFNWDIPMRLPPMSYIRNKRPMNREKTPFTNMQINNVTYLGHGFHISSNFQGNEICNTHTRARPQSTLVIMYPKRVQKLFVITEVRYILGSVKLLFNITFKFIQLKLPCFQLSCIWTWTDTFCTHKNTHYYIRESVM